MEEERVDVSRDLSYRSFTPVSIVCFEAGEIIRLDTKSVGTISGEVRGKREGKKKKNEKKERRKERKKAHFPPPLSGELFLRCLEKHCRYDNDRREGGRRKGEFIGLTMAEARTHLYGAVYVQGAGVWSHVPDMKKNCSGGETLKPFFFPPRPDR